jgi:DNA helicase-2/ATP-dependent DNA helicase PcrA
VDGWNDIRRVARSCHADALSSTSGDRSALNLARALVRKKDLELSYYAAGSRFKVGVLGCFERIAETVHVQSGLEPAEEAETIAHELGHFYLHRDPLHEVTRHSPALGGDRVDGGGAKVEGYSPRERKEVQADVFAGEFLCPADWLRDEFAIRKRKPHEIANALGVRLNVVVNQLVRALLLPPLADLKATKTDGAVIALDESQAKAATWGAGPLLIDAGPGTGKTRTLVHRVKHLLDRGITPGRILALTFSNKAAEEMRERLSPLGPDAAIEMWVGTFHAFGLELIRKWPSAVGRTSAVQPIDDAGSLKLLEDRLARLKLHHFQNLFEPAYELVHVLRAISRCKDELVGPAQYRTEAEKALAAAVATGDEEAITQAEKAVEVAGVYEVYEQALIESDGIDFGDQIWRAAELIEKNADVKAYIDRFDHILVDEYQDVNNASARLLKAIAQAKRGIWVVADERQSIYRFRGAEPSNVARFVGDYNGQKLSLSTNYRSFGAVVQVFEKFSAAMGGGKMAGRWTAKRGKGGEVSLTVSPTVGEEAQSIKSAIERMRENGVAYRDQAILSRTHLTLARLTRTLEQLGVPMLYLGDLFERHEIRDLLSLLGIGAEFGDVGLVRVAGLPEYNVLRTDSRALLKWARVNNMPLNAALVRTDEVDGISPSGKAGLRLLGHHLDGLADASPWTVLTTWLFERSNYLVPLLHSNAPEAQQKLIAIYHLLKVCGEQAAMGHSSRKAFLSRIRRIEALNQDTSYRLVGSEAADMDAVRVMTIHGSKGLEFRGVHFPGLATRYMPTIRQGTRCPPPPSLSYLAMDATGHDAEEGCLFFVALSRAKDFLSLSRAERYTTQNASPSKFLGSISGTVSSVRFSGEGIGATTATALSPPIARTRYQERELALYNQCPSRYRYEVIEELRGAHDETPYLMFHRCVYTAVGLLEQERQAGRPATADIGLDRLATAWEDHGPKGHGFEAYYRAEAERMVRTMASAIAKETGTYERSEWVVPVGGYEVAVTPDRVRVAATGTVHVQRIRTGRKTKSEPDNAIYSLLRRGAAAKYPGKTVSVETFYLSTGEAVVVGPRNDDKLVGEYTSAISGIERGDFHPEPDARRCPNCQCYFMCETNA